MGQLHFISENNGIMKGCFIGRKFSKSYILVTYETIYNIFKIILRFVMLLVSFVLPEVGCKSGLGFVLTYVTFVDFVSLILICRFVAQALIKLQGFHDLLVSQYRL